MLLDYKKRFVEDENGDEKIVQYALLALLNWLVRAVMFSLSSDENILQIYFF